MRFFDNGSRGSVSIIVTLLFCIGASAQSLVSPSDDNRRTVDDGVGPQDVASIARVLPYQGILRDGSGNPGSDRNYNITFRIYDSLTGGNLLWSETVMATTSEGIFTVVLGDASPLNLPFDSEYFLSFQVEGDSESPLRQRLTMVPYSARSDTSEVANQALTANFALDSDNLDGFDSGDFSPTGHDHDGRYVN